MILNHGTLAMFTVGTTFGVVHALARRPYDIDARAVGSVRAAVLEMAALDQISEREPQLMLSLLRALVSTEFSNLNWVVKTLASPESDPECPRAGGPHASCWYSWSRLLRRCFGAQSPSSPSRAPKRVIRRHLVTANNRCGRRTLTLLAGDRWRCAALFSSVRQVEAVADDHHRRPGQP
jgi:hypothetical protein